jgi:tetratricopeptide (TPR) repeat protein
MKKAITLLSKLIELEPKNERNYYKRYRAYLMERKYAHALADLSASLDVNPKYKQGLMQRGKLHLMLGQCSDAVHDFTKLVEVDPAEANAAKQLEKSNQCALYLDEAGRAQSRGDYASAHAYLTQVLEETAVSSVVLLRERAQLSVSLNQPYDAIADLGAVLKLESSNLPALQMRGEVFYTVRTAGCSNQYDAVPVRTLLMHLYCCSWEINAL